MSQRSMQDFLRCSSNVNKRESAFPISRDFCFKERSFFSECFLLSHSVECCLVKHPFLYIQPVLFHLIETEKASTIYLEISPFIPLRLGHTTGISHNHNPSFTRR